MMLAPVNVNRIIPPAERARVWVDGFGAGLTTEHIRQNGILIGIVVHLDKGEHVCAAPRQVTAPGPVPIGPNILQFRTRPAPVTGGAA